MEQNLKYIKRTYLPELAANAGYGFVNNTEASTNHSMQVGVNLSTSVNLMNLKHSIKGADAQLNIADNEINLFKKDLYFEIQKAFNNVEFAIDDVPYAQITAVKALDNLNLVEKQYLSGELNYVALQDARKDYVTAANSYITSIYFYNKSLIQVEEALHCHLIDIHHKGQHAMTNHADELLEHLNDALNCEGKEKPKKRFKKSKDSL
jgi:outer membrane protein TolC